MDSLGGGDGQMDKELQQFLLVEQHKAELQSKIQQLNDLCWDKCMDGKPSNKLDGKTETCLNNCVSRFLDTSRVVSQRFANLLQSQGT